jgi:hypothetical protein
MDRFALPQDAIGREDGSFIEIAAVDNLLANQQLLLRTREEFRGTLRILQRREQLTLVTVLNLANSIGREIHEPSLVGRRYEIGIDAISSETHGPLVRVQDSEQLMATCMSLFEDCEALQDAIRSELHKSHSTYIFVPRTDASDIQNLQRAATG